MKYGRIRGIYIIPDISRKDHDILYRRPRRDYPPPIWQPKSWERILHDFPTLDGAQSPNFIKCYRDGEEHPFDSAMLRDAFGDRRDHDFSFDGPPHVGKSLIRRELRDFLRILKIPYDSIGEPSRDLVRLFGLHTDEIDYRTLRWPAWMLSNRKVNERGLAQWFPKRITIYENAIAHPWIMATALKKLDPSSEAQPDRIVDTLRLWRGDIIDCIVTLTAPEDVILRRKTKVQPTYIKAYLRAIDGLPDFYRRITKGSTKPLTVFTIDASGNDYIATAEHTLRALGTWLTAVHAS